MLNPSFHLWKKNRQEHPEVVSTEVELYQLSTKHAGGHSHMFPFLQTLIFDIVHLHLDDPLRTWINLMMMPETPGLMILNLEHLH